MQTLSIPRFDGIRSRAHEDVPIWKLRAGAAVHGFRRFRALKQIRTVVHFAGFPRSGHSLIGSIIDAHPNARVSHELDSIGLLEAGVPMRSIIALMDRSAAEFTAHGRYWNGYCYYIDEVGHESDASLRVIGDKKGDLAVRRIQNEPGLLTDLNASGPWNKKWICVARNPFDNIATMSLREGRRYDALRVQACSLDDFHQRLARLQAEGVIASRVSRKQIDTYARLCDTVAAMRRDTDTSDWLDLALEDLSASPRVVIGRLLAFLELESNAAYIERCAAHVHTQARRTRDLVEWPADAWQQVAELIEKYPFLFHYAE